VYPLTASIGLIFKLILAITVYSPQLTGLITLYLLSTYNLNVDEASFHYNQHLSPVSAFEVLLSRLCGQPDVREQKMPVFPLKVSS
jgi:hypothetical protein